MTKSLEDIIKNTIREHEEVLNQMLSSGYPLSEMPAPVHQDAPLAGQNSMHINMATMIKAVEFWLNSEVLQCDMTVKSVEYRDYTFTIIMEPQDENTDSG